MNTSIRSRLFRNRNRPRSSIDIRVGSNHLVETLLQLRRADWDWYIENESEIEHELLELLEESIIPRMFGKEMETIYNKDRPVEKKLQIGSKNAKGGRKTKSTKRSRKKEAALRLQEEEDKEKPEKDVYFSFGEIIQLAYRREPLLSKGYMTQHTLFYKEDNAASVAFDYVPKLSHRLLIWISKIDPQNKTNPDPPGVGFYRPELIPISELFREPKIDDIASEQDEDEG